MYIILVASLNENMKLASTLKKQLDEKNVTSEIINLTELEVPMYDSKKEEKDGIPTKILNLIQTMKTAKGYILVSPEYNYSSPPVLINTIAWISRSEDDFREVFNLKTIQLATHSGGGGEHLFAAMRLQLSKLGSIVMPREILTTYEKKLNLESSERILEQFIKFSKEK